MIHLKFKNANTMAYSIVEIENKKYLMDLGSMKGKLYFLGLMPNLITLDMIELTPSDDSFEIKSKPKIGTTTISIMVQPFVALLYRAMESAFISMGLSQQIIIKSILFVLSMLLAYLGAVYYEKTSRRNALSRIPKNSKRYRVKFKPNGKRNPVLLFGFLLNIICLGFFMGISDGSEGAVLVINGLISTFFFFIARMPTIISSCRNKELIPVEIEGL
jgi:hypothetical protein